MTEESAAAVIIRNLKLLDEAATYAEHQIGAKLFGKIDQLGIEWNKRSKWLGKFNFQKDDDWWMAPPNWTTDGKTLSKAFAWFVFGVAPDDDLGASPNTAFLYLTRLCGVKNPMRLSFKVYQPSLKVKKSGWVQFLIKRAEPFEKKGFKLDPDEGHLYFPFAIDPEKLIQALNTDGLDELFEPFGGYLGLARNQVSQNCQGARRILWRGFTRGNHLTSVAA
jgi:hypothetical protein